MRSRYSAPVSGAGGVAALQTALNHVELPRTEAANGWHGGFAVVAAQHRADAGEQLAWVARLGQIIVSADFEADDAVGILAHRREHDDLWPFGTAQAAQDRQPILPGHHQIEDDRIKAPARERQIHRRSVAGLFHVETVSREEAPDQRAEFGIVIDNEDSRGRHSCRSASIGLSEAARRAGK